VDVFRHLVLATFLCIPIVFFLHKVRKREGAVAVHQEKQKSPRIPLIISDKKIRGIRGITWRFDDIHYQEGHSFSGNFSRHPDS